MPKQSMPELLKKCKALGYTIFTQGDFNLNLIGVRAAAQEPNKFCDIFHIIYKHRDIWRWEKYPFTSLAGSFWLLNPSRVTGTAILKHNMQYRGMWILGKHQGRYEALVQQGNECTVWRDNNKDIIADYDGPEESGYFGINAHKAGERGSEFVDRWSAGCQVFANPSHFMRLITLAKSQVLEGQGSKFSYTLIHEDSLNRKKATGPAPKKPKNLKSRGE
jgi:hypothetical protein